LVTLRQGKYFCEELMVLKKEKKMELTGMQIEAKDIHASNGGLSGEINLQWDSVKYALYYLIQKSSNSTSGWKHLDITDEPFYMIKGLRTGRKYYFRIAPVFKQGQGKWSNYISKKAE